MCCGVAVCRSYFLHSVLYGLSCLFLRKVIPCMSPVSVSELYFTAYLFIISVKLYLDAVWTLSVLIACIIPSLGYCYTCFSGCIAVFDVIAAITAEIIFSNRIFGYSVFYLLSFFILRKVGKAVFPVIVLGYRFFRNLFPVCKKVYCDFCRSLSVLVVCIIPGLFSFDLGFLRRMFICDDHISLTVIAI